MTCPDEQQQMNTHNCIAATETYSQASVHSRSSSIFQIQSNFKEVAKVQLHPIWCRWFFIRTASASIISIRINKYKYLHVYFQVFACAVRVREHAKIHSAIN